MNENMFDALRKIDKAVAARNAKFNAMPVNKQRMALAREVLSLIAGNRVSATRGVYLRGHMTPDVRHALPARFNIAYGTAKDIEWQKLLPKVRSCKVCMLGIATFASIKLRDNAMFSKFGRSSSADPDFTQADCVGVLSDLFTSTELTNMEHFFENTSTDIKAKKAVEIFWRHILRMKGGYDTIRLAQDLDKELDRQSRAKQAKRKRD